MKAQALYHAGKLDDAIAALGDELRSNPTDVRARTFLFELLCFAGAFDRAAKQLDVIAGSSREAAMGALVYRSALHAEQIRREMFRTGDFPAALTGEAVSGSLNGKAFTAIADADPRIGARLEVFAAGQYTWIPFEHVAAVRIEAPKRLRDLLWTPAMVQTAPSFGGADLGEVLIPVLAPGSAESETDDVRLGRVTDFVDTGDDVIPVGQKLLIVDEEYVPILEIRNLELTGPATA